jgi:hypothetical protein
LGFLPDRDSHSHWISFSGAGQLFPQDGSGLQGATNSIPFNFPAISVEFLASQYAVAVHYPGWVQFELYSENQLVYTSGVFGSGFIHFAGIVSDVPIDQIRISEPVFGVTFIDNLYFAVPAPGGLAVLALAALAPRRRRRRQ